MRLLWLVLAIGVTFFACSSDDPPSVAEPTSAVEPTGEVTDVTIPAAPVQPCGLVTLAEAEALTGLRLAPGRSTIDGLVAQCDYPTQSRAAGFAMRIDAGVTKEQFDGRLDAGRDAGDSIESVESSIDESYWSADRRNLSGLHIGYMIQIPIPTEDLDDDEALAAAILLLDHIARDLELVGVVASAGEAPSTFIDGVDECLVGDWVLDIGAYAQDIRTTPGNERVDQLSIDGEVTLELSADGSVRIEIDDYEERQVLGDSLDFFELVVESDGSSTGQWGADGTFLNAAWQDLDIPTTLSTYALEEGETSARPGTRANLTTESGVPPQFILPGRAGPYGCDAQRFLYLQPGVDGSGIIVAWIRD